MKVDAPEEAAHAGVDGLFFDHLVLHKVTVQLAWRVAFTTDVLSHGGPDDEEKAETTERDEHLPLLRHGEEEVMLLYGREFLLGVVFMLLKNGLGGCYVLKRNLNVCVSLCVWSPIRSTRIGP